ncbi:hypothetical protein C8J57DRAFT_1095696 [Mycena rebaudengoi]|nr:hypothetical protein C8J57DRAFT_1095696 [Mycena rebaudengoi]
MVDFQQFTGDRNATNEPAAADFIKRLDTQFRATNTTVDADKFVELADRLKSDSPAERWYDELKADASKVTQTTVWAAFCTAFKDRFKAATAVAKPPGQLRAELTRMRIAMEELAGDPVEVGGVKLTPLASFVDRLRDKVKEVSGGRDEIGLWDFYQGLPLVLREASGGVVPANWDALITVLAAVPQGKIEMATEQFRAQQDALRAQHEAVRTQSSMLEEVKALEREIVNLRVAAARAAPATSRNASAPAVAAAAPTPTPTSAAPAAASGNTRVPPTDAQKEALLRVARESVRRTRPNTPEGLAGYATDIAAWNAKFGNLPRRLEVTGHPLTPGAPPPCSGECWRCGFGTNPPHAKSAAGCARAPLPANEAAFRSLCGLWLGRVSLQAPAAVNAVGVVEMVPWYEGTAEEDFVEGLQQ